jgi:hypothetical protein
MDYYSYIVSSMIADSSGQVPAQFIIKNDTLWQQLV